MKRTNEFLVGLAVLVALALVVGGALWLSETHLGHYELVHTARFRTVGGLGVGVPVTLRGVRVGQVEAIRLADGDWVEIDLKIYEGVELPKDPAVIAASASLFGEWTATIVSRHEPGQDPNVQRMIDEAGRAGQKAWPGATLPDVGQLTAQASRIASDVATLTNRIQTAFDTNAVVELRRSIRDFGRVADRLAKFTEDQTSKLGNVSGNLSATSDQVVGASKDLRTILTRIDSATSEGQLRAILNSTRATTGDVQQAAADLRALMSTARSHEATLVGALVTADSILSRIQAGNGTLGLLASDSSLYRETTATMIQLRQLIADIQANPRRYFKFSVF